MPSVIVAATITDKENIKHDITSKINIENEKIIKVWKESKYIAEYTEPYIAEKFRAGNNVRYNLKPFVEFLLQEENKNIDDIIKELAKIKDIHDITAYNLLRKYSVWLQKKGTNAPLALKEKVVLARMLLSYGGVFIIKDRVNELVKFPKSVRRKKTPLVKANITKILLSLDTNKRLRAYVSFLAATGWRASEALYIRNKDIDWTKNPVQVFIHGEHTKTRVDRITYLTQEAAETMRLWLQYKYRPRDKRNRIITYNYKTKPANGESNEDDLVFAPFHTNGDYFRSKDKIELEKYVHTIYSKARRDFAKALELLKLDAKESTGRKKITLHSFRRYVKTTISKLGYSDFSEGFIGHKTSEYWTLEEEEQIKLFRQVEPYLTYLDYQSLEAKAQDIATQLEQAKLHTHENSRDLLSIKHYLEDIKPILDSQDFKDYMNKKNSWKNQFQNQNQNLGQQRQIQKQIQQIDIDPKSDEDEKEIERKYYELQKKKRIKQLQQELDQLNSEQ